MAPTKSPPPTPAEALAQLQAQPPLKLLAIAETLHPKEVSTSQKRESGVSEDSEAAASDTHPAALEADLAHYKDLFTKLRFSYVEQSTKEKYLRSITSTPPILIEPSSNTELEATILSYKAQLQAHKAEIASLLEQLTTTASRLAQRHESIRDRTTLLSQLPHSIAALNSEIQSLSQSQAPRHNNPDLALPLPATASLLSAREAELAHLDVQIAALQNQSIPQKARDLERLERELRPLELQKQGTVAAAREARRRKEEGRGMGNELEERGRWLQASEKALREMLDVEEK